MNFGSQILILNAVEFFAALNNTCISDRTIVLLLPWLQTINKINLPEYSIRIFQSAYFLCPDCESEDIKVALSELNRKNRVERNEN